MKKVILPIIILFLLPSLVSAALTMEIDIKESFGLGETLSFDYTIYSDSEQTIIFIPHISCPNAPIGFLIQQTAHIGAGESYTSTYSGISIDKSIEPQTCTAYIQILAPVHMIEEKNFSIITNPSFSFELKTCKDQACNEKSKVFIKNQDIYLDYDSEVSEPTITAILTAPDQTTLQITLPTSAEAEQIGTYELDITASKQDYKTITRKEQFAVIEKEAEIGFAGACNANNMCEGEETPQNCPQDCTEAAKPNIETILVIVVLIIILVLIYFQIYGKKKKK